MKKIAAFSITLFLTACCNTEVLVRPLDEAIVDAAEKAKAAGAEELVLEMSVTSAFKGTASLPVSVVTIGSEKSKTTGSKVTVKISDLSKWTPPVPVHTPQQRNIYLLDNTTRQIKLLGVDSAGANQ